MQSLSEFRIWRQRHEGLLCEAEVERLARTVQSSRKRNFRMFPALDWELRRYGGRISKLFRALRHAI